ncbi:hypothetical protein MRX96_021237 [Rhipicephalus microplus]
MHLNKVVIAERNYEKLAEGIRGPVAISTTVAVVKFEPSDSFKTTATEVYRNFTILDRNGRVCGVMSVPMSESERNVENALMYALNTNASAQALFVLNHMTPTSEWKLNVAFFDVDRYFLHNDTECPTLRLTNIYRRGRENV